MAGPTIAALCKRLYSRAELEGRERSDQFSILNSQFSSEGARIAICGAMREKVALSDQVEERLVEFAANFA